MMYHKIKKEKKIIVTSPVLARRGESVHSDAGSES